MIQTRWSLAQASPFRQNLPVNRRTSRALALFPLLLFALQTFLPAFSSCPGYASDKDGNRLSRTSSNILLRTLLLNQSQSLNANDQLNGNTHDAN
ncbi:hypothetical protein GCM10007100_31560 [Roseibacillus persicicus]|uniref:Uncharacterized protein n=1 Tax=Roseibacillus persicicus TaxID=454148 RepID=A0A918WLA4_9BACT|nr:hypothetical protein GCM10007100_31560 [Roseibacillus persicicus]